MTSFVLPTSLPAAGGWQLLDWAALQLAATADAGGVATIDCGQVPPGRQWLVDRLVVQCTGAAVPTVRLYDGQVAAAKLLDGTPAGALNSADYPNGLLIRETSSLVVQWTGAAAGAAATLSAQVRVFQRA